MATEKLSEQEIQFRKRARRRLVGAVALVLLMVTILPMVLDDRDAQTPQPEIAVNIPSQDGSDFASRIVPVDPATESPAAASPLPAPATPEPVPAPVPEPKAEVIQAPAPVKAEPPPPVSAQQTADAAEKKAPSGEAYAVQIGVFSDAANVKQLQGKLADAGFKTYTEKVGMSGGTKIRLRVGAYATRAEAEKALEKLKASGTPGMIVAK